MWKSIAVLLVSLAHADATRADVIERVVATVDEDAIFLSDVRQRARPYLRQIAQAPEEQRSELIQQAYTAIIDQMIDEILIRRAAQSTQARVTNEEIDRAISSIKQNYGVDDAQFAEGIAQDGFTEASFREHIRRQLLRRHVVSQRAAQRITIRPEQVRARYDAELANVDRNRAFRASHVFLAVAPGSSAAEVESARARAAALRAELTPETFEAAMTEHGGGSLGVVRRGDLSTDMVSALDELEAGEISEPVRSEAGFHIFLLHERQEPSIPPFETAQARVENLLREEQLARLDEQIIRELRRDVNINKR